MLYAPCWWRREKAFQGFNLFFFWQCPLDFKYNFLWIKWLVIWSNMWYQKESRDIVSAWLRSVAVVVSCRKRGQLSCTPVSTATSLWSRHYWMLVLMWKQEAKWVEVTTCIVGSLTFTLYMYMAAVIFKRRVTSWVHYSCVLWVGFQ